MKRLILIFAILFTFIFSIKVYATDIDPEIVNKQRQYVEERIEQDIKLQAECRNKIPKPIVNNTSKSKKSFNNPADLSKINSIEVNKVYANIVCSNINLNTAVYFGDRADQIEKGVGTYDYGALPGDGKNMIIMDSHNNTYFKPLKSIKVDDIITINTIYGTYDYKVYEVSVYNETDLENWLKQNLYNVPETLMLYTCYPFKSTNYRKTERLVVLASPV